MLNIDFKKISTETESEKELLIVNGILDEDSYVSKITSKSVLLYNDETRDILLSNSFSEVGKTLSQISYSLEFDWCRDDIKIEVTCNEYLDYKYPSIILQIELQNWEHWDEPWSMSSLAKQFEINLHAVQIERVEYWQEDEDSILNGFGLMYFPTDENLIIKQEVDYIITHLGKIWENTLNDLRNSLDNNAVLTYFKFPENIKTACKQYLIYFAQFIADMGINVDTDLKEELNQTLFKIVPQNKEDSLEKIREALSIYLNAPVHPEFEITISRETGIALKQWESNYYHLKSQLSLASSIIQAKDSTIEMLQLSNYQYKQILESHSLKKESEKEQILDGLVELKKFESKGFNINLPEIYRRLNRLIFK